MAIDRKTLKGQILGRLGAFVVDVEIPDSTLNSAIDIAMEEFSHYFPLRKRGILTVSNTQTKYDLPEYGFGVVDVETPTSAVIGDIGNLGFEGIFVLDDLALTRMDDYFAAIQYLEQATKVFSADFDWDYEDGSLYLRNIPDDATEVAYLYLDTHTDTTFPADYTHWLRDFATAEAKASLSQARGKYPDGIPAPGGNVRLNAQELSQEAEQEKARLRETAEGYRVSSPTMEIF